MGLGSFLRGLLPGPASPAGAGSPPAGPSPSSAASSSRPAGSWRALPPIQRTVGSAPLVAPNAPFKAGLAAARPAPTALAPLRHERGLQAPAGLVSGIATPIQRATDPVPGSVRRPAGAQRGRSGTGSAPEPAAWRLADVGTSEGIVWPAFGSGDHDAPEPAPIRQAPVVARAADAPSLVRAPLTTPVPGGRVGGRPAMAAQVAAATASAAATPSATAPALSSSAPEMASAAPGTPAGLAAPGTRAGLAAPSPAPVAPAPVAAAAGSTQPPAVVARSLDGPRVNLGQSRRLRVGAAITPISGSPLGIQRSAATSPAEELTVNRLAPLPAPARAAASPGRAAPSAGIPVAREIAAGEVADAAPDAQGGSEPLAAATEPGPFGTAPGPFATTPVPLRPIAAPRSADAPLVGTLQPHINPASPAVAIHVQAETDDEHEEEEGTPAAALATLARLDQTAGIGQPGGPFGATPSALFPSAGWPGPSRPGATPAAGIRTVARSSDSPPPAWPGAGPGGFTRTSAGGRTITRGSAPAMAPRPGPALQRAMTWDPVNGMTVGTSAVQPEPAAAQGSAMPPAASSAPALPAIAPLVARSIDDAAPALFAPVQREEVAAAPVAGGDGAAGAGTPAGGAMPEAQLDDLARRLHDKIAARLSRDLLIERERSGSLIDRGW